MTEASALGLHPQCFLEAGSEAAPRPARHAARRRRGGSIVAQQRLEDPNRPAFDVESTSEVAATLWCRRDLCTATAWGQQRRPLTALLPPIVQFVR